MSEVALAIPRGLEMAAALSLFGTLVFRLAILPPALGRADRALALTLERRLGRLGWISLVLAFLLALVRLLMETAAMADTKSVAALAAAVPVVALHTHFGHFVLLRLVVLLGAAACLGRGRLGWRYVAATVLAGMAVTLQAGIGHAGAMGSLPLIASEVLHLLAAGAWLGGLMPLFLTIGVLPPALGGSAARKFSPLGTVSVLVLAATALFQGAVLIGSFPALVDTAYGRVALAKLVLFGLLVLLAALNRFGLTPALLGADATGARSRLRRSIAAETGLGLLVVLAAGLLATLEPGMDMRAQMARRSVVRPAASSGTISAAMAASPPPLTAISGAPSGRV